MEKIKKLRKLIIEEKIDGYLVSKNDEFFGEYVPNHNDRLNYISNFSGSFGFALILLKKNYLFVDGRYTLQANNQSGKLYEVVTIPNKVPRDILKNKKLLIGFDPKLFTTKTLQYFFKNTDCKFKALKDNLIDRIWKRKIKNSKKDFYKLPSKSIGKSYKSKINKIVRFLKEKKANYQLISSSENNAWLFNIRGFDTKYTPVPNSCVLIDNKKI